MKYINLDEFIKHLQTIRNKYGNIPVQGNIICGERGSVVSLCVINDDDYDEEDKELMLLVEVAPETKDISNGDFYLYEYPSMKEIK